MRVCVCVCVAGKGVNDFKKYLQINQCLVSLFHGISTFVGY